MDFNLLFERFHNKEKKSFPDIDTDFADPARVKEYLKDKYGEDRVASISNWSTLSPKVIIKDVAIKILKIINIRNNIEISLMNLNNIIVVLIKELFKDI